MLTPRTTEAEVDEPRLLRVEREPEPVQPPIQDTENLPGVEVILERHQLASSEVVEIRRGSGCVAAV